MDAGHPSNRSAWQAPVHSMGQIETLNRVGFVGYVKMYEARERFPHY